MRGGFRRLSTSAGVDTLILKSKGTTDARPAAHPVAVRVAAAARAELGPLGVVRVLRAAEPADADGLVLRDHDRAQHRRHDHRRVDRRGDAAVPVIVKPDEPYEPDARTMIRTSPPAPR